MPLADFPNMCAIVGWLGSERDRTVQSYRGIFLLDMLAACMQAGLHLASRNMYHSDTKIDNFLFALDEDGSEMSKFVENDEDRA